VAAVGHSGVESVGGPGWGSGDDGGTALTEAGEKRGRRMGEATNVGGEVGATTGVLTHFLPSLLFQ